MLGYSIVFLFVFGIFFTNVAHANLDDMVMALPDQTDLSPNWQFGEVLYGTDVETELTELRPDVVNQKFFLTNDESSMSVEVNIFEFDSGVITTKTFNDYAEFLSTNFESLTLQGDRADDCFGIVQNYGFVNEMSAIACKNNSYLVISLAQQDGGAVFENGNQLLTNNVSSGFVTFILTGLENSMEPQIPSWIKNTALWWGQNQITDNEFISGLQYLIQNNVIVVNEASSESISSEIPDWVRNTALWWAEDKISDTEFVKAIEYLIHNGMVTI